MVRTLAVAFLLVAGWPVAAQDSAAQERQKEFAGKWEAKFKGKVICTLTLQAGEPMTGETSGCSIQVDANGDLQEAEDTPPDTPSAIVNAKLADETLTFEEKAGDDVIKFEMKLAGEGEAELRLLDAPVKVKPIRFIKKTEKT